MFRGRLKKELHPSVIKNITKPYLYAAQKELAHHFYIHKAHVIMLKREGLLTADEAKQILRGLSELEKEDIYGGQLDEGTDLYMNLESQLIKKVGDVAGKMHIGRSRNDIYATSVRMEVRNQIIITVDYLLGLIESILEVAEIHIKTLMPGYTHWQHAQPVTLAHYLTGITQSLIRDLDRLTSVFERTNHCPLGAAALATTGFPINRENVASLLGFDGIIENSYDAVASRDFIAECSSVLAILMTTLSRLAEDFIIWNTYEFSVIDMPEEFSATSSIMPQKKNPIVLEHIKGRTGHVIATVTSTLTVLKGTSFSHNREVGGEAASMVHNAFKLVQGCLEMLAHLFPLIIFNEKRMLERVTQGFSTVTELTDLLVREKGISFRQAHHIIGQVVNEILDKDKGIEEISSEMVDQASREIIGYALIVPEEKIKKALDPYYNVIIREVAGGPSPFAVERLISHQREELKRKKGWVSGQHDNLEEARKTCDKAQSEILSGSS